MRLIDEEGEQLGVMSFKEAQDIALQKGLDLIEVASDASPAVYKIGDFGRLRYKEQKKKAEMRKKQKVILLKEIQLRPQIQEHDYQVKLAHAIEFLRNRDKVKIVLQFRGREVMFVDAGKKVVDRLLEDLKKWGKVESAPKFEGARRIIGIVAPDPAKSAASEELVSQE